MERPSPGLAPPRYLPAMRRSFLLAVAAGILAGCARPPATPPAEPVPAPADSPPALPPIPLATDSLAIRVQYPASGSLVEARDTNFIFGTVGDGRASLSIDGRPVTVLPNGAWLAWLPVPRGDSARYELVAVADSDTVRLTVPIRVRPPRPVFGTDSGPIIDSSSVSPGEAPLVLRRDDPVRVSVRAAPDAAVWVQSDSGRYPLVNAAVRPGGSAEQWATALPARIVARRPTLVVARARDTVRLAIGASITIRDEPRWVLLGDTSIVGDADRVVVGRAAPGGTYDWLLLPGTTVALTGETGDYARVRLDRQLEVYVPRDDVRVLPEGFSPPPRAVTGAVTLVPDREWVDVRIPMAERPAHLVEQREHGLDLILYGTAFGPGFVKYGDGDALVRHVGWEQETTDRARLRVDLSAPSFGYLVWWQRGTLVLRLRRPPVVRAARPLDGLVIVVDPGHPPAGATGPSGLYEGDAVLPIGERARELLEARGATVVMTRTTSDPVALGARPIAARRANAHALVSIHLNALPDGVNPFTANGTSTLVFHPQSFPLARFVQREMLRRMGLRDLGVHYQNVALARPTWMPAILCEGAFIMMPEQEAALRTPEFRERYAAAIADGVEAYFRSLAPTAPPR